MNSLDKQYQELLQTILDYGVVKSDRTGTGTKSIFGYTIRHNMKEGFPLLTTKKMYTKGIISELLWFMQGRTDLRWLLENDNKIWVGDAYKRYENLHPEYIRGEYGEESFNFNYLTKEEFINKILTDDDFSKKWGELGPIYGKQWRSWEHNTGDTWVGMSHKSSVKIKIDQLQNSINRLLTNPDCRRNMVTAWQPSELEDMVLPPCHYGFQFYTRELSLDERISLSKKDKGQLYTSWGENLMDEENVPTRAISLLWNQRSVDTPLGLPFNIASYALLLEIVGKIVNMVPDQLIGNLGDTHIYLNQIEGVKEQIGKELTIEERVKLADDNDINISYKLGDYDFVDRQLDNLKIPKKTREPYTLPKLHINDEFWPTQSGECGVGPLVTDLDVLLKNIRIEDFQIKGYQSHPTINFPLSN